MFRNFYLAKINKIVNNSQQPQELEKNKNRFGTLGILDIFDVCLTKFKKQTIVD
jgi:hypothetical protein